jgi:hypothetical protein
MDGSSDPRTPTPAVVLHLTPDQFQAAVRDAVRAECGQVVREMAAILKQTVREVVAAAYGMGGAEPNN